MQLDLLNRIDGWISKNRPHYHAVLQPGATKAFLDAFESEVSLQLPADFRQLYEWHDGQDSMVFESIQGNRSFMSLAEIRETKRELDEMIGLDFEDPKYWRRGWIPFLHNGGGSYLCVDVSAEDGGHSGQLIGFWKADTDRPIEFASVAEWIESIWLAMSNGTLEVD